MRVARNPLRRDFLRSGTAWILYVETGKRSAPLAAYRLIILGSTFGGVLGSLEPSLGRLENILNHLGSVLGSCWRRPGVLEPSWGVPAPLQRHFNAASTPLFATFATSVRQRRFSAASMPLQRRLNAASTPLQRHFSPSTPLQPRFNAASTPL